MSEDEVDIQLEKVVKLLAYISDKDLFSEFYRKKLGRRLLNDSSTHDEAERSILSKLKQQCGTQFTCKARILPDQQMGLSESHTMRSGHLQYNPELRSSCQLPDPGKY